MASVDFDIPAFNGTVRVMAVAWSKQHDFVASTIVGVSSEEQLGSIFAAKDLVLSDEVMRAINRVSREIRYPMG